MRVSKRRPKTGLGREERRRNHRTTQKNQIFHFTARGGFYEPPKFNQRRSLLVQEDFRTDHRSSRALPSAPFFVSASALNHPLATLSSFPNLNRSHLDSWTDKNIIIGSTAEELNKMAYGGHSFGKKTFHKPTYCHHCSDLLWGLIGQGYICEGS